MLEFYSKPGAQKQAIEIRASCFLRRQVGNANCRPRNSPKRVCVSECAMVCVLCAQYQIHVNLITHACVVFRYV